MAESQQLVRQVRAALEHDPRVNLHRHPIAIGYEADGSLVLEGEAESLAAKKIALELAASVHGAAGIVDRLRVAPARPMGDGAIRDHLKDALLSEAAFDLNGISVSEDAEVKTVREPAAPRNDQIEIAVERGVVTLNGRVESLSHKRLAGLLAWWVPGTRDVINGIAVEPPEEDSDAEVTDAIRMALEKDRLIESRSIRVTASGAVVTLDGVVPNQRQAAMAEADAWYIFGVDRVINHLRTPQ
jgi:osmotically-inducible protein OsmY